jgi:hypothetical protein
MRARTPDVGTEAAASVSTRLNNRTLLTACGLHHGRVPLIVQCGADCRRRQEQASAMLTDAADRLEALWARAAGPV